MTATADVDTRPGATSLVVLPVVGMLLCLAGLAISGYLTYSHYHASTVWACPASGVIDCTKVTTSSYSKIFGIPLPVLGLAYFAVLLPLQLPVAWRSASPIVRWTRLAGAGSGIVMVLWLLYVELFRLDAICLYCTGVHVVTLALFALTVMGTAFGPADRAGRRIS